MYISFLNTTINFPKTHYSLQRAFEWSFQFVYRT